MARKIKIVTEAQDDADATNTPEVQQEENKIPRRRRMAREATSKELSELAADGAAADEAADAGSVADEQAATASAPRLASKIAHVIALLERAEGATLAELVDATGWQPHTTRAALTGLKKKGRTIIKEKRGEVTCYRIEALA